MFSSLFVFFLYPLQEDAPSTIVPLVIPVSVPVHKSQAESQGGWTQGRVGQGERTAGQADRKPSVIVARRRSLRNSVTESFGQVGSMLHSFHRLCVFVTSLKTMVRLVALLCSADFLYQVGLCFYGLFRS